MVSRGANCRALPSTEAILEARGLGSRARAGYVVSTRAAWLAHERWRGEITFLPATGSDDCFPICAAVKKSDGDLKDAIDKAFDTLRRSGKLAEVFARWHIPFEPPSISTLQKGKNS